MILRGDIGAWRSLVARTVRVGEVPSSNLGAPIILKSANSREHKRAAAKTLGLVGRCSLVFVGVRGDWGRRGTAATSEVDRKVLG